MAKFRQPPQSAAEATIVSKTIASNGTYYASADNADGYDPVVVEVPGEHATIVSKNITANGTYNASSDSADGYNPVTVAVPEKVIVSKNITANGTYNASQDSADGFDPVVVAVPAPVIKSKSITANGTYNASQDSADGFDPVVVAVPASTIVSKSINANGTYNASADSADGYNPVVVAVPGPVLGIKSISANGTYTAAADGYDGFSSVTVAVSGGAQATITVSYSSIFYNKTMTCSDGITTYTETTTSAGSTVFSVNTSGTWTITCDGVSRTVDVILDYSVQMVISVTVDVYSAASDTVSFTDVTGAKTVTTDSAGHGSVTISFIPPSQNITFTSGVAKNPADLSSYYSKQVAIDNSTTTIYVMPDNALYWYGNECSWLTGGWSANGYKYGSQTNEGITPATNYIPLTKPSGSGNQRNYGTVNTVDISGKTSLKMLSAYSGGTASYVSITISGSGSKYIAVSCENSGGSYWQNFITESSSKTLTGSDFKWNDHNSNPGAMNIYAFLLEA